MRPSPGARTVATENAVARTRCAIPWQQRWVHGKRVAARLTDDLPFQGGVRCWQPVGLWMARLQIRLRGMEGWSPQ
jgi:hypothetical protein